MKSLLGSVTLVVLLAGCYTLQPARGITPEPGSQVALDLNDVGRVALGGSMGPAIAQVEGRLIDSRDGEYLIAVEAVRLLQGGEQVWSGEEVRIKNEYVGYTYRRRFSPKRTVAVTAIGIGGFTAFFLTRSLLGSGNAGDGNGGGPPSTQLVRP